MSLLPSVEQELMRVARVPVGGTGARSPVQGIGRPRLSGAVLAVAVSLVALMIGAGFLIGLRGAGTGPVVQQTLPPPADAGGFPGAPRPTGGHFTRRGMYVCGRAPHNRYLPRDVGCISVLRADMTGGGTKDLVLLYADLGRHRAGADFEPTRFTLEVVRPGGATARSRVQSEPFPWITRVGNINEVPGDELVLHLDDISSGDTYGIYTFRAGRIKLVRPLLSAGGDSASKEGFACEKLRGTATLTSQTLILLGPTIHGRWRWMVTTYAWRGATLRKVGHHTFLRRGEPPKGATYPGGLCGRSTGAGQANPR